MKEKKVCTFFLISFLFHLSVLSFRIYLFLFFPFFCLSISGRDAVPQDHNRAMELYNEAAEEATAAGKGKLAMKYFEAIEYLDC